MSDIKFRAHESFFIRKGWIHKGLKNVRTKRDVFTDNRTQNPMDTLGIGANMVKSLRYWLQAVGLTQEPNTGVRYQELTGFGESVWDNDQYTEEIGTLWLLHYALAKNEKMATSWFYFFNEFRLNEFKKEDFVLSLSNHVKMKHSDETIADSSFEGDFDCIINTYVSRLKSNPEKVRPESNIDCPFGELGLVDIVNKKERVYKKTTPKKENLHPLIILAVILDNSSSETREIRISALQNEPNNIGKVFCLDSVALTDYLYQIANMGYIAVTRTAGLDVIKLETDMSFIDCVNHYYEQINR